MPPYPLERALIITYDEEETIEVYGLTIGVVPIWKWLLEYEVGQVSNEKVHKACEVRLRLFFADLMDFSRNLYVFLGAQTLILIINDG